MNLEQCILEILENFKASQYFDSHSIINELISKSEYHLVYLNGYPLGCTVAQYHGKIAKIISATNLVNQMGIARSHTVYGELSNNMLWQKKIE